MAPSTVYIRASTTLALSSNPSVLRSLASSSIRRSRNTPVRNLWWWSRHGTWSTSNDENIEERIQRHQKIMRHRYSRALRRRAMWDRDDGTSSWLWRDSDGHLGRKWGTCRAMSSTDPQKAGVDDKHDNVSSQRKSWAKTPKTEDVNKDFEAFKTAVDRAMKSDPYGTLFGRRLLSPLTQNNSSWISWLFSSNEPTQAPPPDQQRSTDRKKIEIEVLDKNGSPIKSPPSQTKNVDKSASLSQAPSLPQTEYIYDPISGRKVPTPIVEIKDALQPKQNFLETLFTEHETLPDKPVKQHRVYGHDSKPSKQTTESKGKLGSSSDIKKGFESSRTREYQQLRAATLGTSIDTTVAYGGRFEVEPVTEEDGVEKRIRRVPEPDENAPLFSGTTYESKANDAVQKPIERRVSWLEKEGFQNVDTTTPSRPAPDTAFQGQKLEPSLDRMQAAPGKAQERKFTSKLQPTVDRAQLIKSKEGSSTALKALGVEGPAEVNPTTMAVVPNLRLQIDTDKREDIDLLRASDVRAATKVIRTTKQEAAQAKSEVRDQLEKDFDNVHKETQNEIVPDAHQLRADAVRLSQNIENVRKHAKEHPDGAVAKSMKTIGMVNEKFKDYQKPYNPGRVDLTERLEFKADSLERLPSIYKRTTQKSKDNAYTVSQSVNVEESVGAEVTKSLRLLTKEADEMKKRDDSQIEQLANGIRQIYEAEHGPIDLSLARNSALNEDVYEAASIKIPEPKATLESSTEFFAKQAEFLAKVNQFKESIGAVKAKTAQLETNIKNGLITPSEGSSNTKRLTTEAESIFRDLNATIEAVEQMRPQSTAVPQQQQPPHPLSAATVKPGIPRYHAIEHHTKVFEPRYIQLLHDVKTVRMQLGEINTSLHDLKRSRVTEDVQTASSVPVEKEAAPTISSKTETKTWSSATDSPSPYLLLVYNKTTGEVDHTPMDRLPWSPTEKVEKANPIKIMGNLNYPAAFVTHFVELEKSGYELSSGGGDMLIFSKKRTQHLDCPQSEVSKIMTPGPKILRNAIAAEEASSQPEITETIAQPKHSLQQAATVLDDLPVDIPPGPAVPTAPLDSPVKKTLRPGLKVRRQEHVFSGTIPVRSTPIASQQHSNKDKDNNSSSSNASNEANDLDPGFFVRATRTIKRGVLGVAAFGVAAYSIGAIAEGIGAQAQVEGDDIMGPRKKVVMPVGQRPGIYSTESSRD